jgi:hypothetical protein
MESEIIQRLTHIPPATQGFAKFESSGDIILGSYSFVPFIFSIFSEGGRFKETVLVCSDLKEK